MNEQPSLPLSAGARLTVGMTLAEAERELYRITYEATRWNQSETARCLRVNRNTARKKLAAFGLMRKEVPGE